MPTFMTTVSGKEVNPAAPTPGDISLGDIATGLSHTPRFGGQTKKVMSVAQHSVHVYQLVPLEHRLQGLMHDAAEAYLGDMIYPVKLLVPQFKELELKWAMAIATAVGYDHVLHEAVVTADLQAQLAEARKLGVHNCEEWGLPETDLIVERVWSPREARVEFVKALAELQVKGPK